MRPLIGIPCHSGFREGTGRPIYCNNRAYVHAVQHAGGVPILIPILSDLSELDTLLPRLDGLLLPGGGDVDPGRYGEDPHPLLMLTEPEVDTLEFALTQWALQEDIPTLGICRGIQVLNVALGGSLYQDLPDQYPGSLRHMNATLPRTQIVHSVHVEPGSRMAEILGTQEVWVNSLHHQAIKVPGKGVRITGQAKDGVAELLEVPGHRFMLGVQCHPEEIYTHEPALARLFSAFVKAASPDMLEPEENEVPTTATA